MLHLHWKAATARVRRYAYPRKKRRRVTAKSYMDVWKAYPFCVHPVCREIMVMWSELNFQWVPPYAKSHTLCIFLVGSSLINEIGNHYLRGRLAEAQNGKLGPQTMHYALAMSNVFKDFERPSSAPDQVLAEPLPEIPRRQYNATFYLAFQPCRWRSSKRYRPRRPSSHPTAASRSTSCLLRSRSCCLWRPASTRISFPWFGEQSFFNVGSLCTVSRFGAACCLTFCID